MLLLNVCLMVIIAANLITECYAVTFSQDISEGLVNGRKMKFCEYKLLKMLPKSKFQDAEACLFCLCRKKGLTCKDITNKPGCEKKGGGQYTQNPFDNRWKVMVNKLIQIKYVGKYRVLQVRTQVVAGFNTYLKLLVIDRLCDLKIFRDLNQQETITQDPCNLKRLEY